MPKSRPPYSPEFRRQMVDLVHAGRDPDDLAREFEPTSKVGWVKPTNATPTNPARPAEVSQPHPTLAGFDSPTRCHRRC
jgi:transposase